VNPKFILIFAENLEKVEFLEKRFFGVWTYKIEFKEGE